MTSKELPLRDRIEQGDINELRTIMEQAEKSEIDWIMRAVQLEAEARIPRIPENFHEDLDALREIATRKMPDIPLGLFSEEKDGAN